MRHRLTLLLVFALAVGAHVESLTYWFTTTDTLPLIETSRVTTAGDLVGLFVNPLMHGSNFVHIALFYRPIASLTYALDYALWGRSPTGYHVTNLVLHGAAVVLAAIAVTEITERPRVGELTAVLFALHPLTVEVVPTASRRQDVLMSVFFLGALALFIRSRKHGSRPLLGGALVAYGLALGSKEPAILLPALLFVWVGLERRHEAPAAAIREAVVAVIPFAVVTVAYLAVRLAVLGSLGGYAKDNPLSFAEALFVPVKYLLWTTQPVNVVEVAVRAVSPGLALPALGLAALIVVPLGVTQFERARSLETLSFLLFVLGLVSIPLVLAFSTRVESWLPFDEPAVVVSYLVGLLFIGSCIAGVLAASVAGGSRIGSAVGTPLAFFGVWLLLPLGLFLMSDNLTLRPYDLGYSSHNSYLFIVPAMAIPALVAVAATRRADWRPVGPVPDANVAVVAIVALFLLPVVAASPLFHPYDGWRTSGDVNERTLEAIASEVEPEADGTTVVIEGLPQAVREQQEAYPRVQSISPMRQHTVDAWLRLRYPDRTFEVVIDDTMTLERGSDTISIDRTTAREDAVRLRVSTTSTPPSATGQASRIDRPARPAWRPGMLAPRGHR